MTTNSFISMLESYVPYDVQDAADKQFILDFYKKHDGDIFTRDNEESHMTASCWVVNPSRTKVLMAYHNIYNSFGWLGGHADGEQDMASVAKKELAEESGLKNFKMLAPGIFMTYKLPVLPHTKNGRPIKEHGHIGFAYLFEASDTEPIRVRKGENSRIEWIPVSKILDAVSETDAHMLPVYIRIMEKMRKEGL